MALIIKSESQTFGILAVEKLKDESNNYKKYPKVSKGVFSALSLFCAQSEEFAKAVVESKKTFSECIAFVLDKHGFCLSDLEVYRRAVMFYFEGADISFEMKIHLVPSENAPGEKKAVILNLLDFI